MASTHEEDTFVVEEFEISDESDGDLFENMSDDGETFSSEEDDEDVGLESTLRSLKRQDTNKVTKPKSRDQVVTESTTTSQIETKSDVKPSVIDDFVRNFLIKMSMNETLDTFNREWYEMKSRNEKNEKPEAVPDIYLQNQRLEQELKSLRIQAQDAKEAAAKAQGTWNKFRKERDFHRMHHKRVAQEKKKLIVDLKRLKKHYAGFEPALQALRKKYEKVMSDKMMLKLERDRFKAKCETLEQESGDSSSNNRKPTSPSRRGKGKHTLSKTSSKRSATSSILTSSSKRSSDTPIPSGERVANPYLKLQFEAPEVNDFAMTKTFKGHVSTISSLAFHPKKSIVATASDDSTWKMWSLPSGELIMSGEGHRDWVSDVAFSPTDPQLATTSGDATVKLWDFKSASCVHTFKDHSQAVWGVSYHHEGDFMATCSMDQTSKLWDLRSMRCCQTFRGHVDSVNAICFQPFANNICTASGDKTVSLWDIRSGLCAQTFYGHENSCNDVAFAMSGDVIASSDADGVVRLWDVRSVSQITKIDSGPHPINSINFDRSGKVLLVASDDGSIRIYGDLDKKSPTMLKELKGHADAVQSVLFDPLGKYVVSSSSDCTFRLWSS